MFAAGPTPDALHDVVIDSNAETISITATDRMYPKADGQPELRQAIADYYNEFYDAGITADHVAVFAGGDHADTCCTNATDSATTCSRSN